VTIDFRPRPHEVVDADAVIARPEEHLGPPGHPGRSVAPAVVAHDPTLVARLRQFAKPSTYYALSRVVVLFAALAAKWCVPRLHPFRALTSGWDGYWYTLIAQHGYPPHVVNEGVGSRWAFFPGYPACLRLTVDITRLSYGQAAFLLSIVLGLTSTIAVWLCIREVFGRTVADRAVLLYVFFPAAYVLSMAYTEALFITVSAGCLFALSRRYWISASLFAVMACLTRSFGVVLIACLVVAAVPVIWRERQLRPLVAVVLSPIGFVGWLAYSWWAVGNPLAFVRAESFWDGSHFVWFSSPFVAMIDTLSGRGLRSGQDLLCSVAVIFVLVGVLLLARAKDSGVTIPAFWWIFTVGSILATMSPYEPVSVLRYSMAVIPLFAGYAWRIRPTWESPIVAVLAVSQGALAVVAIIGTLYPHTATVWP